MREKLQANLRTGGNLRCQHGILFGCRGFTLIELLIVILALSIVAMVIIPQISQVTQQTKENTLKENLRTVRAGIEIYYLQHNNTYPGYIKVDDTGSVKGVTTTSEDAEYSFIMQMTNYTAADGSFSTSKDATYKFGPYAKPGSEPVNPFTGDSKTIFDVTTTDITQRVSDGTTGWKFYTKTGVWIANDGDHDDW